MESCVLNVKSTRHAVLVLLKRERIRMHFLTVPVWTSVGIHWTASSALQTIFTFSLWAQLKKFPLRTGNIGAKVFEPCVDLLYWSYWAMLRQSILISWMQKSCKWDMSIFWPKYFASLRSSEKQGLTQNQSKTQGWRNRWWIWWGRKAKKPSPPLPLQTSLSNISPLNFLSLNTRIYSFLLTWWIKK